MSFHRAIDRFIPFLILATAVTGCSVKPRGYSPATPEPELITAEKWSTMTIVIGGARTVVESNGHFTTVPNACYRRESGALDLELWNKVATAVNRMLEQNWLEKPACASRPAGGADLYQPVTLMMRDKQNRELLTSSGGKFCTRSADLDAAADLLVSLTEVADKAKHEGCPARGSFWDESGLFLDRRSDAENAREREPGNRPDHDDNDDQDHDTNDDHPWPHPRPSHTPHPKDDSKREHDRGQQRPEQKGKQDDSEWRNG